MNRVSWQIHASLHTVKSMEISVFTKINDGIGETNVISSIFFVILVESICPSWPIKVGCKNSLNCRVPILLKTVPNNE